jgi:hypothetical protein
MVRRHQGAKMEIFVLKAESVKTGQSVLGYRSIQFFQITQSLSTL